jgi:hypothetical protein
MDEVIWFEENEVKEELSNEMNVKPKHCIACPPN